MNRFDNVLIVGYAQMRIVGKWSYDLIAQDVNFDVFCNLVRSVQDASRTSGPESSESYTAAYLLLKTMRMKEKDIQAWLSAGLKDIKEGQAPWSLDHGPVTAERVREALRQLERDLESGKIVIKEAPRTARVSMTEIASKNDEVISKAEALLTRAYPKSYKRYQTYLVKKLRESVEPAASAAGNSG
jgi:hypothetical protein